jgi:hypothetical protein
MEAVIEMVARSLDIDQMQVQEVGDAVWKR